MTAINREQWLNNAVSELRSIFNINGFPLPDKVRVTCGFPSSKARSQHRSIGEHFSPSASSDGTHEICISPVIDDPVEAFAVLCHELAHSATDGDGHRGRFPACVRALWLEGKVTETVAGDTFKQNFAMLIASLGEYPHAKLNVNSNYKPQSTRMQLAKCPSCGYKVRLSSKWSSVGLPWCSHGSPDISNATRFNLVP